MMDTFATPRFVTFVELIEGHTTLAQYQERLRTLKSRIDRARSYLAKPDSNAELQRAQRE